MGGVRAFRILVAGLALFGLGISLSFVASAATTTEGCCSHTGKALEDADGQALVRPDKDASVPELGYAYFRERRACEVRLWGVHPRSGLIRVALLHPRIASRCQPTVEGKSLRATLGRVADRGLRVR